MKINSQEKAIKENQLLFNKEIQTNNNEWMKKDLETSKNRELEKQKVKFLEEKLAMVEKTIYNKEEEIKALTIRLRYSEATLRHSHENTGLNGKSNSTQ